MDINLTCNNFDRMTDTNKLLYLILVELKRLNPATESKDIVPAKAVKPRETKDAPKTQPEATGAMKCKYCGRMIPGNKGNLLAHIRTCPSKK